MRSPWLWLFFFFFYTFLFHPPTPPPRHYFLTAACVSCCELTVAAGVCFIMSGAFLSVFHSCINLSALRCTVCQTVYSILEQSEVTDNLAASAPLVFYYNCSSGFCIFLHFAEKYLNVWMEKGRTYMRWSWMYRRSWAFFLSFFLFLSTIVLWFLLTTIRTMIARHIVMHYSFFICGWLPASSWQPSH